MRQDLSRKEVQGSR